MQKPPCINLNVLDSKSSFLLKIFSVVAMSFLALMPSSKAQTTITTAAGIGYWYFNGNSDIGEVELEENGNYHGDGYDDAMFVNVTGVNITYTNSFHLSGTYGAVIQQVAITNTGGTPSTFTLSSSGNLGSDGSTTWHYASATNSYYTISSDDGSPTADGSDPVISFFYGDASLNAYTTDMPYTDGSDDAAFTVSDVPIAAGATVRFLILGGIGNIDDANSNRPDQALLAVQNLANYTNWPVDFTNFLTAPEKAEVMNWAAFSTLPVTWQSFTALFQNGNALLKWSTANEQNTKDFTVQHSTDGENWIGIGLLNAAGNSSTEQHYQFIHIAVVTGNNYYRLLQRDIDNKSSISDVRIVWIGKQDRPVTVLGNPVRNGRLTLLLNEMQTVRLVGSGGSLFYQNQLPAGVQQVDVSQLSPGVYFLQSSASVTQVVLISR